jgi:hypothetical protein
MTCPMKVSTLRASLTDTAAITALVDATAGMMFLITPSVSLVWGGMGGFGVWDEVRGWEDVPCSQARVSKQHSSPFVFF